MRQREKVGKDKIGGRGGEERRKKEVKEVEEEVEVGGP